MTTMSDHDKQTTNMKEILSGDTPIHVKFLGWLVIVCAGGFGGWIWWAATISTKLDLVIQGQATQTKAIVAVTEDVSRLKEWRVQVDTVGSPSLLKRVDEISREINLIQKDFELHKATTGKP